MRWVRMLSPRRLRRLRRLVSVVEARPAMRVLLGLAAAFVCGVALGVGVAAMFAPDSADTAARVAGAASKVTGKDADAAPYAVEVKVRQEGQAARREQPQAKPPAMAAQAAPAQEAAAAATPAAESADIRLMAKPAPEPKVDAPAADLSGALPPPAVTLERSPAETPSPAQAPAAAAPAPVIELPMEAETARQIEPPGTVGGVPLPDGPAGSDGQLALGPAGVNGMALPGAHGEAPAPDVSATLPPHPVAKDLTLAMLPMPGDAAWIRNAVKLPPAPRDVVIAVIIDDMGIDQKRSKLAIELPAPLTLSFIPYGYHLKELVAAARAAGHEVMLHLPMEPMDPEADPGPHALRTTVSLEENRRRLEWALSRFDGFVGLNNHMGSKFTSWKAGMELVMQEVQAKGLLFVDSFTSNESVGYALARQHKLPCASRDVFIDHDISRPAIEHSLKELERIARKRGYAVGIAHPHDLSREILKTWIKEAKSRGVDFVPISYIAQRGMKTG
jgi:polysaccharide deacetylase 2 family uncharacterized protein YibQ